MNKFIIFILVIILLLLIYIYSKRETNIVNMTKGTGHGYTTIICGERTYVPYSPVDSYKHGKQIGIVNGNKDDRIYEYKGYPKTEWIINIYVSGLMDSAMLLREINVTDAPQGLHSEYEWNKQKKNKE